MKISKLAFIVDDDPKAFKNISEAFVQNGWSVLPNQNQYVKWITSLNNEHEDEFFNNILSDIKDNIGIGCIILDVKLLSNSSDMSGVKKVLPGIRDGEKFDKQWRENIPILILSNLDPKHFGKEAFVNKCDSIFRKEGFSTDVDLLIYAANRFYESFSLKTEKFIRYNYLQRNLKSIEQNIRELSNIYHKIEYEVQNSIRINKENFEVLIENTTNIYNVVEKSANTVKLTLEANLNSLPKDKLNELNDKYKDELIDALGEMKFNEYERKANASILDELKNKVEDGSVTDLIEYIFNSDMPLVQVFPKLKIMGVVLTTLSKLISKSL